MTHTLLVVGALLCLVPHADAAIIEYLSYRTAGVCSLADSVIQASTETTTRRSRLDCAAVCSNKEEGCVAYTYTESETVFRFI